MACDGKALCDVTLLNYIKFGVKYHKTAGVKITIYQTVSTTYSVTALGYFQNFIFDFSF